MPLNYNTRYQKLLPNSRQIVIVHDFLAISIAWFTAYWLRFNLSNIPTIYLDQVIFYLPLILIVQLTTCWWFGLYKGVWRFASLHDLVRIIKATIVGALFSFALIFIATRMNMVPRSVIPLYCLLLIFLLGGPRFLYRWWKDGKGSLRTGIRVLIVGAGQAGEGLIRDMLRDHSGVYHPVAIIDDDVKKHNCEIHGVSVVGNISEIAKVAKKYAIEMIIIAIPSATAEVMRYIVKQAEIVKIPFRTLPGLINLAEGRVTINALREVSLEDLLGRDPVRLDWPIIKAGIEHRCIVVTGGGGSIGSELCKQIAHLNPRKLVIIEQNEFNLYTIEMELKAQFPQLHYQIYLADIVDKVAVNSIFQQNKPDIVFHAAAYKHVPLLEGQIRTAIQNNIFGTEVVAQVSIDHYVEKFILISTDKAVNPTNILGASKRIAELYCQSINELSETQFITVRFGNVLGSAGSVIPLFRKQIEAGGPITVTHPEITRYFMTTLEAAQLILQAAIIGRGGEILVLDMGQPIKIQYLAEQMIRFAGLETEKNIKIIYTGLRPGEKMYEELFYLYEEHDITEHKKIIKVKAKTLDFNTLLPILQRMKQLCNNDDINALHLQLQKLIPEMSLNFLNDLAAKEDNILHV